MEMILTVRDLIVKVLQNTPYVTGISHSTGSCAATIRYTYGDGLRKHVIMLCVSSDDTEGIRINRYYHGPRAKKFREYGIYMWYPVLECFEESFAEKIGTMHKNITAPAKTPRA